MTEGERDPSPGPDSDGSTDSRPDEEEESGPSDDEIFNVLSNKRRRQVIEYLHEHDGRASVGELAEQIAVAENETTHQQLSSDERKRVYVSLYQNHLPVMDDAGVVEYAEHRKTVRIREPASELEPYLGNEEEGPGTRTLTLPATAAASAVLLGSLQVGPFAAVSRTGWALLGVACLVGIACYEAWETSSDQLRTRLTSVV